MGYSNAFSIHAKKIKSEKREKQQTHLDYEKFHGDNTVAHFKNEDDRLGGRSYADGRFRVLAEISDGYCAPLLSIKLFPKDISSSVTGIDKCADRKEVAKEIEETLNDIKGPKRGT